MSQTIDIKALMTQALKSLAEWGNEHFAEVSLDVGPECEEEWTTDYAIIFFDLSGVGNEFFDYEAALDSAEAVVKETFGDAFTVLNGTRGNSDKRKPGVLYLQFHGGEIEAYRYQSTALDEA